MNFSAGVRPSCFTETPETTDQTVNVYTCMHVQDFLKMFRAGFMFIKLLHDAGEATLNRVTFRITSDDFKKNHNQAYVST